MEMSDHSVRLAWHRPRPMNAGRYSEAHPTRTTPVRARAARNACDVPLLPPLRALVDGEAEDVGAGVVADGIEVETGSGQGIRIEISVENAFFAVERTREVVTER